MRNLIDRRGRRNGKGPSHRQPLGNRSAATPVEVVTHQGKVYLHPFDPTVGTLEKTGPTRSMADGIRAGLITLLLLAGMVIAIHAFMAVFAATFEATSRALPMGSLTAPSRDAAHALVRERDRRREALASFDRHIASAEGNPPLQAAWHDLKRREVEALEQLERHLDHLRRSHPPPASVGRGR